jgi:hypothetical protein
MGRASRGRTSAASWRPHAAAAGSKQSRRSRATRDPQCPQRATPSRPEPCRVVHPLRAEQARNGSPSRWRSWAIATVGRRLGLPLRPPRNQGCSECALRLLVPPARRTVRPGRMLIPGTAAVWRRPVAAVLLVVRSGTRRPLLAVGGAVGNQASRSAARPRHLPPTRPPPGLTTRLQSWRSRSLTTRGRPYPVHLGIGVERGRSGARSCRIALRAVISVRRSTRCRAACPRPLRSQRSDRCRPPSKVLRAD